MNLNNKYLAIVLSVVAVGAVMYQVFFNKPSTPVNNNAGRAILMPGQKAPAQRPASQGITPVTPTQSDSTGSGQQAPETGTMDAATQTAAAGTSPALTTMDGGPVIDYNSQLLLKRIPMEMTVPFPKDQLPDDFGKPIFSRGKTEEKTKKQMTAKPEQEIVYQLNAIIIDTQRQLAIINDTILRTGDIIQGAKVLSIVKGRVLLEIGNKKILLATNARIKRVRLIGGTSED